ncbi:MULTISPECIES: type I polyketide synthase [Streptomyces]|uniref:type I polyketide synthase n=1 Tax=Streptomyces TaxID=1883 RepID=UPI001E6366D1|nr:MULTISPECIES: type I polyketide synthase [Streptomyces]UFQ14397.1 polyketide synthase dehydratase domain-containing protein [Streptomyces huasconensis]WCL83997.1 beta-ketoacyl synthase N-terminal-like domain-containing protein [Streptomyces sp. JCM 35825]
MADYPIAIVGLGSIFPQADDISEFWSNVTFGRDAVTDVPPAWWDPAEHFDPNPLAEDKTYARRGGFISPQAFDPRAFGMTPKSLDSVGLVQLLSLAVARGTLADAARGREGWYPPDRTGVILGMAGVSTTLIPLAARLYAPAVSQNLRDLGHGEDAIRAFNETFLASLPSWTEDSFPGTLGNVVAGRIANRLDLRAANHTVDAACASSLAAVRAAVDELLTHRADVMITGGCDADNSIVSFLCFSKTPALSPSGRVRPFDTAADGTLLGEGLGMLALKRLPDAERDGDRVYAVLKGLGSASDGRGKSIYAPCGDGQLTALRRAYADADCPPSTVELIEAHGTGTATGDEVELTALTRLLADSAPRRSVAVGSVKSQIGHTKAAAGAAGLIKAALALHQRVLPGTLHVEHPREPADHPDSPLYINTTSRPWIRDPARPVRRAGVSAFGFGGINYHAVLEEHASTRTGRPQVLHRTPRAYLWHAPDPQRLLERLERGDAPDDEAVPADHARLGFVAVDDAHCDALRAQAARALKKVLAGEAWAGGPDLHYRRHAEPHVKVGALFAGQGSQYVNMGRASVMAVPPLREAFDEANMVSPPQDTLARAVFPPPGDDTDAEAMLCRTAYAQPAIGALSRGQYGFLAELGFAPDGVLGHSFGELTALWAARVLDDAGFTALAHARGRALRPADGCEDPGAMAAVRTGEPELEALLAEHPGLRVCNRNAPDEHVVGGTTDDVRRFLDACRGAGVAARWLPVAAAFHTPLVEHALAPFAEACRTVDFAEPRITVYANTAGAQYGPDAARNRDTLTRQLLAPVDFCARVRQMYDDGTRVFVEFGPRQVLSRLTERILHGREAHVISCDSGDPADGTTLLTAAVRLAVLGLPLSHINRYAAPAPAQPPLSAAARELNGPRFAELTCRPRYERALSRLAAPPPQPAPATADEPTVPTPAAAATADDELERAAVAHLRAHTQFMETQLATTRRLCDLMGMQAARPTADPGLSEGLQSVARHGLALTEAHTRAADVITELLRGEPLPVEPSPTTADPAPVAPPPAYESTSASDLPAPESGAVYVPAQEGPRYGESGAGGTSHPSGDRSALGALLFDAEDESRDGGHGGGQGGSQGGGLERPVEMPSSEEEILERCRAVMAEKTGHDPSMLDSGLLLQEDLGLDSLKMVELGAELWRLYPSIKREDLFRFTEARTLGELAAMFAEELHSDRSPLRHTGSGSLDRTYVTMVPLAEPDRVVDAFAPSPRALVLDDGGELSAQLSDTLVRHGWDVRRLALPDAGVADGGVADGGHGLADWSEDSLEEGVRLALGDPSRLDLCLLPVSRSAPADETALVARLRHAILVAKRTQYALRATAQGERRGAFVTVTQLDGALGYAGSQGDTTAALAAGLSGLVKSLALEATPVFCRALDFAPDLAPHDLAEAFVGELTDPATAVREVGHGHPRGRVTPRLTSRPDSLLPAPEATHELSDDDVLLVTGGGQGITAWCATALARRHRCTYLLLGRTPLTEPEPLWALDVDGEEELRRSFRAHTATHGTDGDAATDSDAATDDDVERQVRRVLSARAVHDTLRTLREHGARAEYVTADLLDPDGVAKALAPYAPRVTGVLHGAGVLGDRPLSQMRANGIAPVVDTKLLGLRHILTALDPDRLRHLVVFSSVSGLSGNVRQSDYALANESVTRFACAFKTTHPTCRVTPVAWGPWRGGMADRVHHLFEEMGVPVLTREQGTSYFLEQMDPRHTADGVTLIGPVKPLLNVATPLPAAGVTVRRRITGLAEEPVLVDHRVGGHPLLPMTAVVGWSLHTVENICGGWRPVVECHDVVINRGVYFDGGQPAHVDLTLTPRPDASSVAVSTHPDTASGGAAPRFSGVFTCADAPPTAPTVALPPLPDDIRIDGDRTNPAYSDGTLFHGPSLTGLRTVVEHGEDRLVVLARMAEPALARGSFSGRLFTPGLADLLLQAAGVMWSALPTPGGCFAPVGVERVELYAPLPDDEPFVIVARSEELNALDGFCTMTACDTRGTVLQRWTRLRMLRLPEARVARMLASPARQAGASHV